MDPNLSDRHLIHCVMVIPIPLAVPSLCAFVCRSGFVKVKLGSGYIHEWQFTCHLSP